MARKLSGARKAMFVPYNETTREFDFDNKADLVGMLEALKTTKNYKEGSNYADNVQNIYRKALQSEDIDADFTEIGYKNRSILFGKKYYKGGIAAATNDKAPTGALLFEQTYDDNSFERVVLYNVSLYEKDIEAETDSENYNYKSQGFTGKALPFEHEGIKWVEYRMDSADPNLDKESFDKWYEEIQFLPKIKLEYEATGSVTAISSDYITYDSVSKKFLIPFDFAENFTFKDGEDSKTATYSSSTKTWTIA